MNLGDMDVVYPVGPDRDPNMLRYSLRSLRNLPHRKVWVAGTVYPWLTDVHTIALTPQASKWVNINQSIFHAVKDAGLSKRFVMLNDDFFITRHVDSITGYHQGELHEFIDWLYDIGKPEESDWFKAVRRTARIFGGSSRAYECHTPLIFDAEATYAFLRLYDWDTAYGCFYDYVRPDDVPVARGQDVKVRPDYDGAPGPFLSCSPRTWPRMRQHLHTLFPDPSPHEVNE